uniref:Putative secreted protein n=1 Tax=Ixodes scapularis TaxID=6945 RepID=A0A4D5RYG2_IXOSC
MSFMETTGFSLFYLYLNAAAFIWTMREKVLLAHSLCHQVQFQIFILHSNITFWNKAFVLGGPLPISRRLGICEGRRRHIHFAGGLCYVLAAQLLKSITVHQNK